MSANERAEAFLMVIKRLAKWVAIGVAGVLALVLIGLGFYDAKDSYDKRPKVVDEFNGIKLGEKVQDFIFKNPEFIIDDDALKFEGDDKVFYVNKNKSTYAAVSGGKVVEITYVCRESLDYTDVGEVRCHSSGELIASRFKKDVLIFCLKDKSDSRYAKYRLYKVSKYGVTYHLYSNSVDAFNVESISEAKKGIANWGGCE